jgi:hypothetical protein
MTTIHPLLLEGSALESWETLIPSFVNELLNPFDKTNIVKDIIRLAPGKYIIMLNATNSIVAGLFRELYSDTARFVFTSEYVYEVSIADVTKQRYLVPSEFKTKAPYYQLTGPIILYKGRRPRQYACEYYEEPFMNRL